MKRREIFYLRVIWLIFFILYLIKPPSWSQTEFSKRSLEWRYDPDNEIHVNYRIARDDSLYHIYFSLNLPENIDFLNQIGIDYEVRPSVDADEVVFTRTVNFTVHGVGMDRTSRFFHIEIPDADNFNIMFLNVKNRESGKSYTWDIPLVSETVYPPPDFMLFNKTSGQPECMDYAHISDSFIIHDFNKKERAFFVYFYNTDFDIADPPMYRLKKNVSKEMEINSLFKVYPDSAFVLDQEGLYFIQSDTTSFSGIGIRIENDFYPRIASVMQLVAPLAYLSTKEESEKLLKSDNLRASFERFWLDLAKSEEGAKNMIKKYYDRITEANRLFTNYKEGWKSDMGMIYTVIGPPDEVYRGEGKESWYYKNPGRNQIVVFNFLNLKNLFCDNHYMLIRDNQYKSFWFKAIDKWRKGIY